MKKRYSFILVALFIVTTMSVTAYAAMPSLSFTVNLSENVVVDTTGGTPTISINVGGVSRTATYVSGTGTNALIFTYAPTAGDLDLDGIAVTSPIVLNGGIINDIAGNAATLAFTAPNTANVKVSYPSLSMDFLNGTSGRYSLNGAAYTSLSTFLTAASGSFTRASNATYFDASGNLQTAGANIPRFDHDRTTLIPKGILIEDSKTNSSWNSQMSGAVLGVIGSGGVLPTGWSSQLAIISGTGTIVAEILATGTLNGMNYMDIKYSGSITSGTGVLDVVFGPSIATTAGTTWTLSAYAALIGGSFTANVNNVCPKAKYSNSGGSYIGETACTIGLPSATLTRNRQTITTPVNTASFSARYAMYISTGAYNFTLRYSAPQTELGAIPTSYIPTPVGGTATRAADVLTMPTGGWYNVANGALSTQSITPFMGGGVYPGSASLDDGTGANAIHLFLADLTGGQISSEIFNTAVAQAGDYGANYVAGNTLKHAMYYDINAARQSYNGVLRPADTSVTIPTVNLLRVGARRAGTNKLNGWLQNLKYYPLRPSDAQLQLLTQ